MKYITITDIDNWESNFPDPEDKGIIKSLYSQPWELRDSEIKDLQSTAKAYTFLMSSKTNEDRNIDCIKAVINIVFERRKAKIKKEMQND